MNVLDLYSYGMRPFLSHTDIIFYKKGAPNASDPVCQRGGVVAGGDGSKGKHFLVKNIGMRPFLSYTDIIFYKKGRPKRFRPRPPRGGAAAGGDEG